MADPEHLAKLNEGVSDWNAWRSNNSEILSPDLSGAGLPEAKLSGANLRWVDLTETDLNGADLRGTDFRGAHLIEANLNAAHLDGADLSGAILSGANLRGVNLSSANLSGADLTEANLNGANLNGVNVRVAELGYTSFGGANLRNVTGLDSCHHIGPSYLDYFMLAQSWPLPVPFLRGCGLPSQYIDNLPSLLMEAGQFYSCFISHSTKDKKFAERIWGDLQNKNVPCWYAPEDLKIGDRFQERIEESIRVHDKLLLVLSENFVDSTWVEREVLAAREREDRTGKLVLFPIRLDDAVMVASRAWAADLRRTRHIGDFTHWKDHDSYQKAFERLLRDLKADEASTPTVAPK